MWTERNAYVWFKEWEKRWAGIAWSSMNIHADKKSEIAFYLFEMDHHFKRLTINHIMLIWRIAFFTVEYNSFILL